MKVIILTVLVALMMGDLHLHAQKFSGELTSEWQSTFRESNYINLLTLNAEVSCGESFKLEASTISIANTRGSRLIDDYQVYSNIEEDNLVLALSMCGANWNVNDNNSISLGIRNVNEDYFTSSVTSIYTNSSCGIFPTISANYPIANYPLAAVGLHYKYESEYVTSQVSLYNGQGSKSISGHHNIFRFCPKSDGIFCIQEVQYHNNSILLSMGNTLYCNNRVSYSPWLYIEHSLGGNVDILACYSHSFAGSECSDFLGAGVKIQTHSIDVAAFADYALFSDGKEFTTELTCRTSIVSNVDIQPVLHIINTTRSSDNIKYTKLSVVGMFRLIIAF